MLTADADDFTGTANDDTFTAPLTGDGSMTLQTFDRIDGGEGTDRLNATFEGGVAWNAAELGAIVTNIENFYLRALDNTNVDFTGVTEAEQIWADRTIGANTTLTVGDVQQAVTLGIIRGETNAGGDISTFGVTYADDALDSDDYTQAIVLDRAIQTLNVAVGGDDAITALELNLTGANRLVLGDVGGEVGTITTTGEGSIDLDATGANIFGDEGVSVTLGDGDDTLRIENGVLIDTDTEIDLGGGTNTLAITGLADVSNLDFRNADNVDAITFLDAVTEGGRVNLGDVNVVTFADAAVASDLEDNVLLNTSDSELTVNFTAAGGVSDFELQAGSNVESLTLTASGNTDATVGTSDTERLEITSRESGGEQALSTLSVVDNSRDGDIEFFLDIPEDGARDLTTIDLSGAGVGEFDADADEWIGGLVDIDVEDANFRSDLTISIGESNVAYSSGAGGNNVQEVFEFVGSDIAEISIEGFTVSTGGSGDKMDFSGFAGVNSINDLRIVEEAGEFVITARDGQFDGEITIETVGTEEPSFFEANAFIF